MAVALFSTGNAAGYASEILVDTVLYDAGQNRYPFNLSEAGSITHRTALMLAPGISSASCTATDCDVVVTIPELTFNPAGTTGGLYGDVDPVAASTIAGYELVALQAAAPPGSGMRTTYPIAISDADRFIPASAPPSGGIATSGTITVPLGNPSDALFLAYVPVFNAAVYPPTAPYPPAVGCATPLHLGTGRGPGRRWPRRSGGLGRLGADRPGCGSDHQLHRPVPRLLERAAGLDHRLRARHRRLHDLPRGPAPPATGRR